MEPLKDIYNRKVLTDFASQVQEAQPDFKSIDFVGAVLNNDWDQLSLRKRMKKIATLLGEYLAGSLEEKFALILKLHEKNQGFNFLFLPDFISIHGLSEEHLLLSLTYLKQLTVFSSSEFAIREFMQLDQETTISFLLECSLDENEHIRRLASEGSRPRLPWGCQLNSIKQDPQLCLPILSNLKNDPSLYVRKSVANHLNDISKDHPDFVIARCKEWVGATRETDWIIKRACRSLLKEGYLPALELLGYDKPGDSFKIMKAAIKVERPIIKIGGETVFSYSLETTIKTQIPIRLEYGINYVKANGQRSLKKFHLFDGLVSKSKLNGSKKISFKQLSTRTHYPGNHPLFLFCNGKKIAEASILIE